MTEQIVATRDRDEAMSMLLRGHSVVRVDRTSPRSIPRFVRLSPESVYAERPVYLNSWSIPDLAEEVSS